MTSSEHEARASSLAAVNNLAVRLAKARFRCTSCLKAKFPGELESIA